MDGHPPSLGWSPSNQRMVTYQKEVDIPRTTTNPRMVTHLKEVYYRLRILNLDLTHKTNPIDNCLEWSPNIPRMVTHQPKDGHPTEGSILQTQNLTL